MAKSIGTAGGEPTLKSVLLWLTLFTITFGFCESALVYYLHDLFYPDGFSYPFLPFHTKMLIVDMVREIAATLVIVVVVCMAARGLWRRFALFMYVFGLWEILYYAWLYLLEGWPKSLLSNDLIFLVPVPWSGPVLAPLLISVFLILSAAVIIYFELKTGRFAPGWVPPALTLLGWALMLYAFMVDFMKVYERQIPGPYRWDLFAVGMALWAAAILMALRPRTAKSKS